MELIQETRSWSGLEELRPRLRSFLRRLCRDDYEVDDVIQETLLRAARYRPSLADPQRLAAWAVRIAGNVFRDQRRREARLSRSDTDTEVDWCEALVGREPAPGEHEDDGPILLGTLTLAKSDALRVLGAALQELKPEDRQVLSSYYDGGSCRLVALECDISPTLVKVRLFRARRRLLQVLQLSIARRAASLGGEHVRLA